MEQKKQNLTAAELRIKEILEEVFVTIHGKATIPELNKQLGLPKAILKYAKVEARTGLTSKPTVVVDRFVDGELFYTKDVVIRGIPKSVLIKLDYSGIATEYVRHPTYSPDKMIKATEKEIMGLR